MDKSKPIELSRLVHGLAHRALKIQPLGSAFCALASAIGLTALSARASHHSRYVPKIVRFNVTGSDQKIRQGALLSADGNDQIARSIWLHGLQAYEAPLPRLFMALVQGSSVVMDIGANSGLYAILAALSEPHCHIYSFEPYPPALNWLRQNLRNNAIESQVTVVNSAAGSKRGETNLFIPEKTFGEALETSASLVKEFREKHSAVIKIQVDTLDDFVARNNIPAVSLIRADVEGFEHEVLHGATNILKTHRPYVFVEVLSEVTANYLERLRGPADYRIAAIGEDSLKFIAGETCIRGSFNHLWYPSERHDAIQATAKRLNLTTISST